MEGPSIEAWLSEPVERLRAAIAVRSVVPSELVAASLRRIGQVEPELRAFITVTRASATDDGHRCDRLVGAAGPPLGLLGVPFGLKDNIDAAGWPTTAASTFLRSNVAVEDAPLVARLRAAGAILVGKLNMHEFASGVTSVNEAFGTCVNPYDLACIPGGSSSGSAVAVATGEVGFAIGTDTGGSVRIPAALCGIVGLKPTTGRVPTRGIIPSSWTLDHAGPMTRTVRDAALVLGVIAGYDSEDAYSIAQPVDDYLSGIEAGVAGLRLAMPRSILADVSTDIGSAAAAVVDELERRGAVISDVDWPEIEASVDIHRVIVDADIAAYQRERFAAAPAEFDPDLGARIARGRARAATELALARRAQLGMVRSIDRRLAEIDALVLPTTPIVAPRRAGLDGAWASETLTSLVRPFSLFGTPAISLPIGFVGRLPIGLQIVTARWSEAKLLRIARAAERAAAFERGVMALDLTGREAGGGVQPPEGVQT